MKSQGATEKAPLHVTPEVVSPSHLLAPVKVSVKANPNLADKIIAFRPSAPLQKWGDGGIWSQLQLLCILHAGPGE